MSITFGDVLDAMERDKTPKAKGDYYDDTGAYCALGGAAKELGMVMATLGFAHWPSACPTLPHHHEDAFTQIADLNDYTRWSKRTIARKLRDSGCFDLSFVVVP